MSKDGKQEFISEYEKWLIKCEEAIKAPAQIFLFAMTIMYSTFFKDEPVKVWHVLNIALLLSVILKQNDLSARSKEE